MQAIIDLRVKHAQNMLDIYAQAYERQMEQSREYWGKAHETRDTKVRTFYAKYARTWQMYAQWSRNRALQHEAVLVQYL